MAPSALLELRTTARYSQWFLKTDKANPTPALAAALGVAPAAAPAAAPKAPAKKAKKAEEDDDIDFDDDDLFGSDDEDDAEAAKEAMRSAALKAAIAKNKAKGKVDKSLIVFEVKPYEVEFDLNELAKGIKALNHEGIQNWGQEHKLVPVAYGIFKLIISCVVFDDKIGQDDIIDMIQDKWDDDVQSVDIQSMSKV